jgi:hypothetical protein
MSRLVPFAAGLPSLQKFVGANEPLACQDYRSRRGFQASAELYFTITATLLGLVAPILQVVDRASCATAFTDTSELALVRLRGLTNPTAGRSCRNSLLDVWHSPYFSIVCRVAKI